MVLIIYALWPRRWFCDVIRHGPVILFSRGQTPDAYTLEAQYGDHWKFIFRRSELPRRNGAKDLEHTSLFLSFCHFSLKKWHEFRYSSRRVQITRFYLRRWVHSICEAIIWLDSPPSWNVFIWTPELGPCHLGAPICYWINFSEVVVLNCRAWIEVSSLKVS